MTHKWTSQWDKSFDDQQQQPQSRSNLHPPPQEFKRAKCTNQLRSSKLATDFEVVYEQPPNSCLVWRWKIIAIQPQSGERRETEGETCTCGE